MFQEGHLQLPAQHQECPSPALKGANGWYFFIIKVHKYIPTIPSAIVALRHLSSEDGDLKVDWMKCLVSTDCEA